MILEMMERMVAHIFKGAVEISFPFPALSYNEAMNRLQ